MGATANRFSRAFSFKGNLARLVTAPSGRLRPLDGLRALSVLWVVCFHAGWYARFALPFPEWVKLVFVPWLLPVWRGDFGVDLFFVLSGFLIAGMLLDEQTSSGRISLGLFYVRRLLRLWPALVVVAFVELLTNDPLRVMVWANVFYLNDFIPVGIMALAWTWSLAIEEQFYLVCPWLLRAVQRLSTGARVGVTGAVIFGFVGVAARVVIANDIRPWDSEIMGNFDMARWGFDFDVFYDKPWMRAGGLLSGVMAAMVYRAPRWMGVLSRGESLTVTLTLAALLMAGMSTHWPLVVGQSRAIEVLYLATFRTVFGLASAFILLVVLSDHPLGRALAVPLSSRLLYPIAQLAYTAYLVNPLVTMFFGRLFAPEFLHVHPPMLLLAPCDVVGTFAAATLLHLSVERPGMNLRPHAPRAPSA